MPCTRRLPCLFEMRLCAGVCFCIDDAFHVSHVVDDDVCVVGFDFAGHDEAVDFVFCDFW